MFSTLFELDTKNKVRVHADEILFNVNHTKFGNNAPDMSLKHNITIQEQPRLNLGEGGT